MYVQWNISTVFAFAVLQQLTPSRASTNDTGSSQAMQASSSRPAVTSTPNSCAPSPNLGHSGHSIVTMRAMSPKAPKPRARPNSICSDVHGPAPGHEPSRAEP
jgi:hypothetical protein